MSTLPPYATRLTHIYTGPLDEAPEDPTGSSYIFFPVSYTTDFKIAVIDAQCYAAEIGVLVSFDDLRYAVVATQPSWMEFSEEDEAYCVLAVDTGP